MKVRCSGDSTLWICTRPIFVLIGIALAAFLLESCISRVANAGEVENNVLLRYGFTGSSDAASRDALRFVEVFQTRGPWIGPVVNFIDFGAADYHEVAVGGGRVLVAGKHGVLGGIAYIMTTTGSGSADAEWYFQPLVFAELNLHRRVTVKAGVVPYVPLSESATKQLAIDHVKLAIDLGPVTIAPGYAGFKFGDSDWSHKPFLSIEPKGLLGSPEFWIQNLPGGGAQFQIRLSF